MFFRTVLLLAAINFRITSCQLNCKLEHYKCGGMYGRCCNTLACNNGICEYACALDGQKCGLRYGLCCKSLLCNDRIDGTCVISPNECRELNTRCTENADAPFYEKCCDGFICEGANGSRLSGTCKKDSSVTPGPCRELHELCLSDSDCCENRQCVTDEYPVPLVGVCRDRNETSPYCFVEPQLCLEGKCCKEYHCAYNQEIGVSTCLHGLPSKNCSSASERCSPLFGQNCCEGYHCGDVDGSFKCIASPTCLAVEDACNPTHSLPCCDGLACYATDVNSDGQCGVDTESTTEVNEEKTSIATLTTTTATTTTVKPPFCVKQNDACLLGVLLKTCCPGLKCSALVLGKCIPA